MQTGAATVENSMEVPQKFQNRTTLWSSNCTTGHLPKGYENTNLKKDMHLYVYSSSIYNSQIMEAAQVFINRWMDKEDVVCTMEYYSAIKKNAILTSTATWMDLESK